jgi:hypothetical protein
MFRLTAAEFAALTSQFAISNQGRGTRRTLPYAFTEHGAIMAANVLNSRRAVQMAVFVVRAFLKMRALLGDKRELAKKLASLEKELKQRLDVHEAAIVTILQRVMDVIDPPRSSVSTSQTAYWLSRLISVCLRRCFQRSCLPRRLLAKPGRAVSPARRRDV